MNDTAPPPFLITGAGGRVGATGSLIARQLLAAGKPVRAFVYRDDDRACELRDLGAEIAVGDLRDFRDVRTALEAVQRAYFTYPVSEGLLEATATFAAAGKQAGLEWIVNMSQIIATPDHQSPATRQHWTAEQVLDWSGIGIVNLRPPFFHELLMTLAAGTIQNQGRIYVPWGEGRNAIVGAYDLARLATAILIDPEPHRGKTYVPTGPVSLSGTEMASAFTRVLGRPVEYIDIPVDPFRQILSAAGMSAHTVEHLARAAEGHARGEMDGVTHVIEEITGLPPKSLEEFVRDNPEVFTVARG